MSLPLAAGAAPRAQVEVFTPQGTVKGVRQVAARFSEQMVTFGDPSIPEPFAIDCPESGKGRWADARNWVYDFARDLPAGVKCTFKLKTDVTTLAGKSLVGGQEFCVPGDRFGPRLGVQGQNENLVLVDAGIAIVRQRGRAGAGFLADLVRRLDLPLAGDDGAVTALVDLGKPAYRLGIASIRVGWAPHRLVVTLKPDAEVHKVRERAKGADYG